MTVRTVTVYIALLCPMLLGGCVGSTRIQQLRPTAEIKQVNRPSGLQEAVSNTRKTSLPENNPVSQAISLPVSVSRPTEVSGELERMERCRRELEALKKINPDVYARRRVEFERLISGASIYNGVRSDVGGHIRNTVDAFYRYKSDKLCADIASDVLNGLTR
ncbi:hypothetical protein KUS98_004698 [Escherichia coli]|uniref:hypothetical protein n=1 Tax=Escherichia sp. 14.0982 TaxID=2723300 RepID=UPI00159471AF|nr:hypothetical protein [Escherichia sp. 14.0982]EHR8245440.1 hypothetical protein [Escherichia coli]MBB2408143.1 hypothetical protein [Escherichia sp. 14.0982]